MSQWPDESRRASGSGPDEPARRRGRRAVRPAGTVGDVDESLLRSSFPAAPAAGGTSTGSAARRRDGGDPHRPAAPSADDGGSDDPAAPGADDSGPDDPAAPSASAGQSDEAAPGAAGGAPPSARARRRAPDDEDVGWGARVDDSNDGRLARERPPHW